MQTSNHRVQDRLWLTGEASPDVPALLHAPCERTLAEVVDFGIAVVDKPSGPTSHDIVDRVRHILRLGKAGHGGTLDPKVTGVLPVFLGRATRLSSLILEDGKAYTALARFHRPLSDSSLDDLISDFQGRIRQLPPVRSRVKRVERERWIYDLQVIAFNGSDLRFHVECEAGTYIRKLVHDMGEAAGTGAHMAELRRTRAGPFTLSDALRLEDLDPGRPGYDGNALSRQLIPGEKLAASMCRLILDDRAALAVRHGATLAVPGVTALEIPFRKGDPLALLDDRGRFFALSEALMDHDGFVFGGKGLLARPKRVLLPPS